MSNQIDDVDINHIMARPLYFGMLVNVLIPMALLFLCFLVNQNNMPTNQLGDSEKLVLVLFNVAAVAQAGFAWHWRRRLYGQPMIHRMETASADIASAYSRQSRPLFYLIASISIWGYLWFFLTGQFQVGVWFILFSFIIFQLVRPRYGFVRKLIEKQLAMAERGETARDGLV